MICHPVFLVMVIRHKSVCRPKLETKNLSPAQVTEETFVEENGEPSVAVEETPEKKKVGKSAGEGGKQVVAL